MRRKSQKQGTITIGEERQNKVSYQRLLFSLMILMFAIFVMLFIMIGTVEAKTITVDDDGGANFKSIQEAIDASDSNDTIIVRAGIYREHIIIQKSLTIIGEDKENTVINGSGNEITVNITANDVVFSGFNITGSSGSEDAGILLDSSQNGLIFNLKIHSNFYGIHLVSTNNSSIENNEFYDNKLGIFSTSSHSNTIIKNILRNDNIRLVRSNTIL